MATEKKVAAPKPVAKPRAKAAPKPKVVKSEVPKRDLKNPKPTTKPRAKAPSVAAQPKANLPVTTNSGGSGSGAKTPGTSLMKRPGTAVVKSPGTAVAVRKGTSVVPRKGTAVMKRPSTSLAKRAGTAVANVAKRVGPSIASRAGALGAAGTAGFVAGTALNKKFNISGKIVNAISPSKDPNAKANVDSTGKSTKIVLKAKKPVTPSPTPASKKGGSAKPSKTRVAFNAAFKAARSSGKKEFEFKGKKFNTKLK